MGDKACIEVRKEVLEKAEKLARESGFESVSELVEFLIEEAASSLGEEVLTSEDEERIKERLKDLGYM